MNADPYFSINNVTLWQTRGIVDLFRDLVADFEQFIEIGFWRGGLTLLLKALARPETEIVAYDITREHLEVGPEHQLDFRIADCFAPEIAAEIVALIRAPKRTVVLCDGGDKQREFQLFSAYLKPNDVIMLHDYADSVDDYRAIAMRRGWPSPPESHYFQIAGAVEANGLVKYRYDAFKDVFWGAFIKPGDVSVTAP